MEILYLLKEVFVDRIRAILTLFAIAWGTLAISLMLAVGPGLLVSLSQFMSQMGSHLTVAVPGESTSVSQGNLAGIPLQFTPQDIEMFKHLSFVKDLSVEYSIGDQLIRSGDSINTQISGVDEQYRKLHPVTLGVGRFIDQNDIAHTRNVIVLGYSIAKTLFKNTDPLGQSVHLGPYTLQVVGISEDNPNQFSFYEGSNNYLTWLPISTFKEMYPTKTPQFVLINTTISNSQTIQNAIIAGVARLHHLDPNDQGIVQFRSNEEALKSIRGFFMGLQWFLGALGGITLLIASFGIANMMYLTVKRAIPVIGLRMALGAKPSQIAVHYLIEALVLSVLGGLTGLILTASTLSIANPILAHLQLLGPVPLHLELSLPLVLIIIFILGIVGLSAGIFPSLQAAKIQPIEALRHE